MTLATRLRATSKDSLSWLPSGVKPEFWILVLVVSGLVGLVVVCVCVLLPVVA